MFLTLVSAVKSEGYLQVQKTDVLNFVWLVLNTVKERISLSWNSS